MDANSTRIPFVNFVYMKMLRVISNCREEAMRAQKISTRSLKKLSATKNKQNSWRKAR